MTFFLKYGHVEGTELYGHSPMIYAKHATNIAITGQGTIDAQGGREFASWSQIEVSDRNRLRKMGEKLIPVTRKDLWGKVLYYVPLAYNSWDVLAF